MTNKYDSEFVGIMRRGALSNKMFSLLRDHPEDQDMIVEAFLKQDKIVIEYEQIVYKDCMTEY